MRRMVRPVGDIDVILFDAGGVLVLPDPTVLGPLLACYGGDSSLAAQYHAIRPWPDRGDAATQCQGGEGSHTPVRCIVDSHAVGVSKPDPGIFDHALRQFDGIARHRIAYVGDSITMDVAGARAAGLHPILLDPYDDHAEADVDRIRSVHDLVLERRLLNGVRGQRR